MCLLGLHPYNCPPATGQRNLCTPSGPYHPQLPRRMRDAQEQ